MKECTREQVYYVYVGNKLVIHMCRIHKETCANFNKMHARRTRIFFQSKNVI